MSARRAGSVVWALEPGRRVGRLPKQYRPRVRFRQTPDGPGRGEAAMFSSLHRRLVDSSPFAESNSPPSARAPFRAPAIRRRPPGCRRLIVCRGGESVSLAWSVPTRAARLGLVASLLGLVSLAGAVPVGAAGQISLTTPYPAVAAAPRSAVNFEISITNDTPDRVDLSVTGAPADWSAALRGGGFTVDGVETDGTK